MTVSRSRRLAGAAMMAPIMATIAVFIALPVGVMVWLSVHRWDLLGAPAFVGLDNFEAVLADPAVTRSAATTLILGVVVVPAQTALGLLVAFLLERAGRLASLYRVVLLLPWVAAPIASGLVWRWILASDGGVISRLVGRRIDLLDMPVGALLTVMAVMIWSGVGYVSLFFTAALHAIPSDVHDAATLDGVTSGQRLRQIQLPLLRPMLTFLMLNTTVQALVSFDVVYGLTGGGPDQATEVIALNIYNAAFRTFDLGAAAVLSLLLFAALTALAVFQYRYLDGGGDEPIA